jgi:hypothetical protein
MLRYALVIGAVLISTSALSEGKDASYYCTTQHAAGLAFDVQTKQWRPVVFKEDYTFVLHLHYLGDKTGQRNIANIFLGPGPRDVTVHYERYSATITLRGSNTKDQCFDPDDKDAVPGEIDVFDVDGKMSEVSCEAKSLLADFGLYRFNFVNNRFVHVSNIRVGFLAGGDDNKEPQYKTGPEVLASTCTTIQ